MYSSGGNTALTGKGKRVQSKSGLFFFVTMSTYGKGRRNILVMYIRENNYVHT